MPTRRSRMTRRTIVITGTGARLRRRHATRTRCSTRSCARPLGDRARSQQWDTTGWPVTHGRRKSPDFNARALVDDRKLHKLIRRTDMFGLYAGDRADRRRRHAGPRDAVDADAAARIQRSQRPLRRLRRRRVQVPVRYLSADERGRRRTAGVRPRPRQRGQSDVAVAHAAEQRAVPCRHQVRARRARNACITNHSVGGTLAVIEAAEALRQGEADRAVAIGHDAPIEPQMRALLPPVRPACARHRSDRSTRRSGSLFGEGAGALALETEAPRSSANAPVLGEVLGGGYAGEAQDCSRFATTATALPRDRRRRWPTPASRRATSA